MSHDIAGFMPTSTATTKETEPEVVAGISSGDLNPNQKLSIRADEHQSSYGRYGRMLMLLAAGLAVGYLAARWARSAR